MRHREKSLWTCPLLLTLFTAPALGQASSDWSGDAMPSFGEWGTPVNIGAPINTLTVDSAPFLVKGGKTMYFQSLRAGGLGIQDIWVSHRDRHGAWGEPANVTAVNSPAIDLVPALSSDGHYLFFASNRPGGQGGFDIWSSYRHDKHGDLGWGAPTPITAINSPALDAGPSYLAGKEDEGRPAHLFFASNRGGTNDIYVSTQTADGSWGPAVLVPELSTSFDDSRPSIRRDGLEIFFNSTRGGDPDLWVATRASLDDPWSEPTNVGSIVNSAADEIQCNLSWDGRTLMFGSNREGTFGSYDIYMTTRGKLDDDDHDEPDDHDE